MQGTSSGNLSFQDNGLEKFVQPATPYFNFTFNHDYQYEMICGSLTLFCCCSQDFDTTDIEVSAKGVQYNVDCEGFLVSEYRSVSYCYSQLHVSVIVVIVYKC